MNVTFVIATYKRADALRCTLRSLQLQSHEDWTAIVVGDRCGAETEEAVRALGGDPRIRYYNLPERFGEQSGPNNAGLALARGDFVSFLNHDDLLLGDHTEHALERLASADAAFFYGSFANAMRVDRSAAGNPEPVFTQVHPRDRRLFPMVTRDRAAFEPSSYWVVRTDFARRVGPWRRATTLWRSPLRDWLLRAWGAGGRFCFGDRVTGLRFLTQWENPEETRLVYSMDAPEIEAMVEHLERETPDETRRWILDQVAREPVPRRPRFLRRVRRGARHVVGAALFRGFGIDLAALERRMRGEPRGELLEEASRKRLGVSLPRAGDIDAFLSDPEAHRVV